MEKNSKYRATADSMILLEKRIERPHVVILGADLYRGPCHQA